MPRAWAWATASAASATSRAAAFGSSLYRSSSGTRLPPDDQLHGEELLAVVLADLVDRDDARVIEQGDGLGLVLEPAQLVVAGEQPGLDHLQGDGAVEADLAGLVDDAHAAAAQLPADLVVAEVADEIASRQAVAVVARRGGAGVGSVRRLTDGASEVGRLERPVASDAAPAAASCSVLVAPAGPRT